MDLKKLINANLHIYSTQKNCHKKMLPYIYKIKKSLYIFDLRQTAYFLQKACNFIKLIAKKNIFLFVGTQKNILGLIKQEAIKCESFFINYKWINGLLTNWLTINKLIQLLKKLEQHIYTKTLNKLPKKEIIKILKKKNLLLNYLQGLQHITAQPTVLILSNPQKDVGALMEAKSLNIPIIAIANAAQNPDLITIPIPANTTSFSSIHFILQHLSAAILAGKTISSNLK